MTERRSRLSGLGLQLPTEEEDNERKARLRALGLSVDAEAMSTSAAPNDMQQPDLSYWDEVGQNVVPSIKERGREVLDFGLNMAMVPPEIIGQDEDATGSRGKQAGDMLRTLGKLGVGMGLEQQAGPAGMMDPVEPGSSRDLYRRGMQEESHYFTKEGFKEDPTRGLSMIAGLVPLAPKGTPLHKATRIARLGDPVNAAVEAGGLATQAGHILGSAGGRLHRGLTGTTSGRGIPAVEEAYQQSKQGRSLAIAEARSGADRERLMGADALAAPREDLARLGARKGAFIEAADQQGVTIDVSDLRNALLSPDGILNEMGIKKELVNGVYELEFPTHIADDPAMRGFVTAVDELLRPSTTPQWTPGLGRGAMPQGHIKVEQLDNLKMAMDQPRARTLLGEKRLKELRAKIREKLSEVEVEMDGVQTTYDQVVDPLAAQHEWMRETGGELGVDLEKKPRENLTQRQRQVGRKLTAGLGKVDDADAQAGLARYDEKYSGLNLTARASGRQMRQWLPSDLLGRGILYGAVGGSVGAGGYVGGLEGVLIPLLTTPVVAVAFVPRVASGYFSAMGRGSAKAKQVVDIARKAIDQAESMGINTRTMEFGQVLDRLDQEREKMEQETQQRGLMDNLSSIPLTSGYPRPQR